MIAWLKRQNAWYWNQNREKTPRWIVSFGIIAIACATLYSGWWLLDSTSAAIMKVIFLIWWLIFATWTARQWWKERP